MVDKWSIRLQKSALCGQNFLYPDTRKTLDLQGFPLISSLPDLNRRPTHYERGISFSPHFSKSEKALIYKAFSTFYFLCFYLLLSIVFSLWSTNGRQKRPTIKM